MKNTLCLLLFYTFFSYTQTEEKNLIDMQVVKINDNLSYIYTKPKIWDTFKYVRKDYIEFGKYLIQKDHLPQVGAAVAGTIALIPVDRKLLDNATEIGSKIGWDKEGEYLHISGVRMLPADSSSAIYHIGNGGTTLLLSAGFLIYGKINNDYRALNTSSELAEVLISVGLVTQTIKRITGRQSPIRAISSENESGHWTPFPSFKSYQTNTPNYDAMPSGHLATYVASLFVISTNYPEKKWIKPVGYTLGGLLAFKMVSSKVHWTSDYPFAVLIGYAIGKNAANRRIKKTQSIKIGKVKYNYKINYNLSNFGDNLIGGINVTF
jgi:hypothetical protein